MQRIWKRGGDFYEKRTPLRGIIVGLCAVILCTSLPLRAQAAYFRDVPINAWYRQAVNSLADDGILNGTGNGYYSPQATLTRGAFVTMLARASLSSSDLAQYTFAAISGMCPPAIGPTAM